MQDYRKLDVWKVAHPFVLQIYKVTRGYPREETYSLVSQTRRAATSIPANIAEGCGRDNDGDFRRFLQIALGSAMELDYHLLLAQELQYIETETHVELSMQLDRIRKMLAGFIKRLQ